jgi:hypothetical protein
MSGIVAEQSSDSEGQHSHQVIRIRWRITSIKYPIAKMFDGLAKWLHNRGLHLKKYEGSAQMEAM